MHGPNQAPSLQFANTGTHVGTGNAQGTCNFLSRKSRSGNVEKGVDLGHRPVDSPARSHLSPVENELLLGCTQMRHISLITELTELTVKCQDNFFAHPGLSFSTADLEKHEPRPRGTLFWQQRRKAGVESSQPSLLVDRESE